MCDKCNCKNKVLIPYSYAMKIRKKYAEFVENKTWNPDVYWIADNYEEFNIIEQCPKVVINKKDKVYKKIKDGFCDDEDLILSCFDDNNIDWDLTDEECKELMFDTEIINACKLFLIPFRGILSREFDENTDLPDDMQRCYDYCNDGCLLIAYKFGRKGVEFVDVWGCSDGIIGLIDYCVDLLNKEAVNVEID